MQGEQKTLPAWMTTLDHTADEGVEVHASSLAELFERTAWAMFSLLADMTAVRPAERQVLCVEATDREALLVRWLSELNFLHQTEHQVYSRFNILEMCDTRLMAEVWGEAIAVCHRVHKEFKAVTFCGLSIREEAHEWTARVLFDV